MCYFPESWLGVFGMDAEGLNVYFIGPRWWLAGWEEGLSSLNIQCRDYFFTDFLLEVISLALLEATECF